MLLTKRASMPRKFNSNRQLIKSKQFLKKLKEAIASLRSAEKSNQNQPSESKVVSLCGRANWLPLCLDVDRYAFDKGDCQSARRQDEITLDYNDRLGFKFSLSCVLTNMQLKNSRNRLDFPYVPSHILKRHVLHCNTACFGLRNSTFRKAKRHVLQPTECQTIIPSGSRCRF